MGLFLQKTNIIRDYREDLDDKRRFWPKEVWSKYAKDLSDFADPKQYTLLFDSLMKGIKLHLRNDTDLNRTRNRLSNIPLRPPRPIRLQLLRNPSSHGYSNLSSRLSQPPRFPTKHQNAPRRNGIGTFLPNKTNSGSY